MSLARRIQILRYWGAFCQGFFCLLARFFLVLVLRRRFVSGLLPGGDGIWPATESSESIAAQVVKMGLPRILQLAGGEVRRVFEGAVELGQRLFRAASFEMRLAQREVRLRTGRGLRASLPRRLRARNRHLRGLGMSRPTGSARGPTGETKSERPWP